MSTHIPSPQEFEDIITLSSSSDAIGIDYDSTFTISNGYGTDTISISPNSIPALTLGSALTPNSIYTTTILPTPGITTTGTGATVGPWANTAMSVNPNGSIALQGDGADITINGVKLSETLKALQERLNVLVPNPKLEKEWEELAELGRQYRELEKHITEKMVTWDKLKSMPKIDVK